MCTIEYTFLNRGITWGGSSCSTHTQRKRQKYLSTVVRVPLTMRGHMTKSEQKQNNLERRAGAKTHRRSVNRKYEKSQIHILKSTFTNSDNNLELRRVAIVDVLELCRTR